MRAALLAVAALPAAGAAEVPTPPPDVGVVWLGEVHDNPAHHAAQAEVVARLAPSALVLEMLEPRHAEAPVDRADPAGMAAAWEWEARGWPPFALYAPVLLATDAPVFGAALPPDAVRASVTEGAAAVFGEDAARFGLDAPLPPGEQAAREGVQAAAHCDALPEAMLPGFVEAQRLRDAALARTALDALEATGGPVAVIAGTGHVRADWGAPAMLARVAPEVAQWTLGQVEGDAADATGAAGATGPFDAVLSADAPERPDPCAAFR